MPKFSLIIGTVGRSSELERFFASLLEAGPLDCECIVVDQNSDDRLVPLLERWNELLKIVHIRTTMGLSRARNLGLNYATGQIVSFPDDDCWYSPGLLAQVESFFAHNPVYSMLSVGVRDENEVLSGNRWLVDSCDLNNANLFRTSVGYALFVKQHEVTTEMRFDESLGVGAGTPFACGEDTDFVFRLLDAGLRGRFNRKLTVYHPRRDMMSGAASANRAFSYGCGMGRVIRKRARNLLLPAFLGFDIVRSCVSVLRGRLAPAALCFAHGRGILAGYLAPE